MRVWADLREGPAGTMPGRDPFLSMEAKREWSVFAFTRPTGYFPLAAVPYESALPFVGARGPQARGTTRP